MLGPRSSHDLERMDDTIIAFVIVSVVARKILWWLRRRCWQKSFVASFHYKNELLEDCEILLIVVALDEIMQYLYFDMVIHTREDDEMML